MPRRQTAGRCTPGAGESGTNRHEEEKREDPSALYQTGKKRYNNCEKKGTEEKGMSKTITAQGSAELRVAPDTVTVGLDLSGVKETYEETLEEITSKTAKLRACVAQAGLDPEELKTGSFRVYPHTRGEHDDRGNWREVFDGYGYEHSLTVTMPKEELRLGQMLRAFSASGTDAAFSLEYSVRDEEKVKDALLEAAVKDAVHRIGVLARAAGIGETRILEIRHGAPVRVYAERSLEMKSLAAGANYDAVSVEPDTVTMRDEVTVTAQAD